ncbi:MAG: crotonase/enoyl-CoA hydratase family protein [Gammaproteobacteria bacterium]|jgi:DSF synthase
MARQAGHSVDLDFFEALSQMRVNYDSEQQALWFYMHAFPRPCYTPDLLSELDDLFEKLKESDDIHYLVAASGVQQVYNLGGDLELFIKYIEENEREKLRQYAYDCVMCCYNGATQIRRGITTIALVQGSALGGGFEAALACNVVVAEESAMMGFPEILFNLFPGMGAFSFLGRRIPMPQVEKMILSGQQYTAAELYEMGAIDVLAKDGEGEKAVKEYIETHSAQRKTRVAIHRSRDRVNPITMYELKDIVDIWVDLAMEVDEDGLRVMQRLVRAQNRKLSTAKLVSDVVNA